MTKTRSGGSKPGTLFVLSAPSGTGKTSLAKQLLRQTEGMDWSVSYTTRPRREREQDGVEYHFVDDAAFDRMVADGALLEWAEVFGRRYGTGHDATSRQLDRGLDLLVEIDVQGAAQIRESGMPAVSIFVVPPSYAALVARLRGRHTETEDEIANRLRKAREEAEQFRGFDYVVVNDEFGRALADLKAIVRAERRRVPRASQDVETILAGFPGPDTAGTER